MGISQQIGASSQIKPGVCTSTTRPASPYTGQVIFETDTNKMLVWNTTAWVIPNSPAQNPGGLELIKTCTVTSVGGTAATASGGVVTIGTSNTSVTVENAFSANYDNYKIVMSGGTSSSQQPITLVIGGSTGTYYGGLVYANYSTGAVAGDAINNASSFLYAGGADINSLNVNLELQSPFLAKYTNIQALTVGYATVKGMAKGDHETAASYTSFKLAPFSGNFSGGIIRVYGYRNS